MHHVVRKVKEAAPSSESKFFPFSFTAIPIQPSLDSSTHQVRSSHNKLKSFAKNPDATPMYFIHLETPKRVASKLITGYAEHLDKNPHLVEVYNQMKLSNNPQNMLHSSG